MGNPFDSALAISIERGLLDDLISELLRRIMNIEYIVHVLTDTIVGNLKFIAPGAMFVKCNTQKVLSELKACDLMKNSWNPNVSEGVGQYWYYSHIWKACSSKSGLITTCFAGR